MTLTNRLTLFFLAALGVVLASFSGTIYVLARTHLMRQLNDRATATLDTLVAAAEVESDGLEWEPKDRRILLRSEGEPPSWAVYDENGRPLDGSANPAHSLESFAAAGADMEQSRVNVTWDHAHWRVVRRTLRYPRPDAVRTTEARKRYRTLVFVTAWPVAPVHDLLWNMGWGLGGTSVAFWIVAGVCGRWVCRQALAPVRRMTESAREITADDWGARLPIPHARDELRDLASRFNELLARLQDSFDRQRRFTAEASHQLRTPLTAMLGQMEVALRRSREPDEYRRVLALSVAQAGRLRGIVEALLFLARADANAEIPHLRTIDLAEWLRAYLMDHHCDRRDDIRLAAPVANGLRARTEPAMLGQVLDVLIDNACKYSAPGTPVVVSAYLAGEEVVMAVNDSGCGIDAAEVARVFEPFFRSADARRRGVNGWGLGLAIAARIVTSLGGRIEVRSEANRGCCFTVRLPQASEAPPEAALRTGG